MKNKTIAMLVAGATLAISSCSKSKSGMGGSSGYVCTCHFRVQFTYHDTTVVSPFPAGTTQSDAAQGCVNMNNFYTITYGDNTAHCGL